MEKDINFQLLCSNILVLRTSVTNSSGIVTPCLQKFYQTNTTEPNFVLFAWIEFLYLPESWVLRQETRHPQVTRLLCGAGVGCWHTVQWHDPDPWTRAPEPGTGHWGPGFRDQCPVDALSVLWRLCEMEHTLDRLDVNLDLWKNILITGVVTECELWQIMKLFSN